MMWLEEQSQKYWGNIVVTVELYRVHRVEEGMDRIELITFDYKEAYRFMVGQL